MSDRINPDPGILLYTRIKKSPYYYGSRRHGVALYSVYNHHYHPRHYGDPFDEYWQLLEGVTVWDVGGAERQVEITGPDAFEFTNMLTPRNLARCEVGQCKYAFITDERGGIINDPVLLRLGENHFWLSLADTDVLLWAKGVAYNLGPRRADHRARRGPAADPGTEVQGGDDGPVRRRHPGACLLLHGRAASSTACDLVISRTGYSGELGLRAVPARRQPRRAQAVGRRDRGRRAARALADRAVPHPPDRGRHPRARLRHDDRGEPLRGRLRLQVDGRARPGAGLHRPGGAARGRRSRASTASSSASRSAARLGAYNDGSMPDFFAVSQDGREGRQGHLGVLLAAAGQEHRLRDGARRAVSEHRHRARGRAPGGDRRRLSSPTASSSGPSTPSSNSPTPART